VIAYYRRAAADRKALLAKLQKNDDARRKGFHRASLEWQNR
jgi:hypothetical protein